MLRDAEILHNLLVKYKFIVCKVLVWRGAQSYERVLGHIEFLSEHTVVGVLSSMTLSEQANPRARTHSLSLARAHTHTRARARTHTLARAVQTGPAER